MQDPLNQENKTLHESILQKSQISQDVKFEIENALASGKEVTLHENDIAVGAWAGSGYLIIDPVTGTGAYKIS